tara:strand:- start:21151 stop:21414 length:264 start_codon:yes stop_codon:yes gene_type:complete
MKKIASYIFESSKYYHIRIPMFTPYLTHLTYIIDKDEPIEKIIERRKEIIEIWKNAKKNTTMDNDIIWKYETDYLHGDGKYKFWYLV